MEKLTLTVEEMADTLNISRTKAYEMVHVEGFPVVRVGRRIVIPVDALRAWLMQSSLKSGA